MASEHRGRSLIAESITIVFGILPAFAMDAAWNSRREREEEVRFLGAIDAEITRRSGIRSRAHRRPIQVSV